MVGLTHATLVVEAKERSGSLITARLATDYNRELLVVPGSIFSEGSKGTHQFLKLGATPVTESSDILKALGIEVQAKSDELGVDLNDDERTVLTILEVPLSRDELLSSLSLSTSEANVLLSIMEIKGLIKEELGAVRRALSSK
jgi:DNA processing protein